MQRNETTEKEVKSVRSCSPLSGCFVKNFDICWGEAKLSGIECAAVPIIIMIMIMIIKE